MADRVQLEVVTPGRIVIALDADMVVIPGEDGDIGVLPGHSPLLTTVRSGLVDIHDGGKVIKRIFVSGGFAEVTGEATTLLTDEAVAIDDVNAADVAARLADARQAVDEAGDGDDASAAGKMLDRVLALQAALEQAGKI